MDQADQRRRESELPHREKVDETDHLILYRLGKAYERAKDAYEERKKQLDGIRWREQQPFSGRRLDDEHWAVLEARLDELERERDRAHAAWWPARVGAIARLMQRYVNEPLSVQDAKERELRSSPDIAIDQMVRVFLAQPEASPASHPAQGHARVDEAWSEKVGRAREWEVEQAAAEERRSQLEADRRLVKQYEEAQLELLSRDAIFEAVERADQERERRKAEDPEKFAREEADERKQLEQTTREFLERVKNPFVHMPPLRLPELFPSNSEPADSEELSSDVPLSAPPNLYAGAGVPYMTPRRLTEAEIDVRIADVDARLAAEPDKRAREKLEQDRRGLLQQLAIRIAESRGWREEQLSLFDAEIQAWVDWIPDGTLDYESKSAWMRAIPDLPTHILEGIASQVRHVRDHPEQFVGMPEPTSTAQRQITVENLTPNQQRWRTELTSGVEDYRDKHSARSPSFRAFALWVGNGDTGAITTWRWRIKNNPVIVDPALNWPAGDAMARRPAKKKLRITTQTTQKPVHFQD